MIDYYDREGNPLDDAEFMRLFSKGESYRRVARDEVGKYLVSTVWLGIDHGFGEVGPLIFETMVFESGNSNNVVCKRYATEAMALAGHHNIVRRLRRESMATKGDAMRTT